MTWPWTNSEKSCANCFDADALYGIHRTDGLTVRLCGACKDLVLSAGARWDGHAGRLARTT